MFIQLPLLCWEGYRVEEPSPVLREFALWLDMYKVREFFHGLVRCRLFPLLQIGEQAQRLNLTVTVGAAC